MSDLSRRALAGADSRRCRNSPVGPDPAAGSGYRTHNILEYGAKGDGQTLDTAAVQRGDRRLPRRSRRRGAGAGRRFPGRHAGVEEQRHAASVGSGRLLGSGKPADYSAGKGVPPGNGNVVLLYAVDAENVTIEGPGTIDGQGQLFYTGKGDNTGPGGNAAEGYRERPHLGIFYRCRNLLVRDVFLTRSAYHCVRLLECRYVRLDGVRIHNRVNLNNDGFHINSNQYVNIVNCNVMCQDDACALFGSNKFVTVTNCTFSTRWSIFRFGSGECENITISNCVIYDTYGCVIKMRFSAGARIENVVVLQSGDAQRDRADLDRAGLELPAAGERAGSAAAEGRGPQSDLPGDSRHGGFRRRAVRGHAVPQQLPAGRDAKLHHAQRRRRRVSGRHHDERCPRDVRGRRHGGGGGAARDSEDGGRVLRAGHAAGVRAVRAQCPGADVERCALRGGGAGSAAGDGVRSCARTRR